MSGLSLRERSVTSPFAGMAGRIFLGMTMIASGFFWSSYRSYVGLDKKLEYVTYGPVLAETGAKRRRRQTEYRRYVEAGMAETDTDFLEVLKESGIAIGGDEFRAWVRDASIELGEKAAKEDLEGQISGAASA